jgi:hypothetical protein
MLGLIVNDLPLVMVGIQLRQLPAAQLSANPKHINWKMQTAMPLNIYLLSCNLPRVSIRELQSHRNKLRVGR